MYYRIYYIYLKKQGIIWLDVCFYLLFIYSCVFCRACKCVTLKGTSACDVTSRGVTNTGVNTKPEFVTPQLVTSRAEVPFDVTHLHEV